MSWRRLWRRSGAPDGGDGVAVVEAAAEDRGWRAAGAPGLRELPWAEVLENLTTVTAAYRENPLAFRLVQLQVDYVLGEGMALRSADPRVQAELDHWWHHPLNQLALRQFDFLTALAMDGEIFVSRHLNPYDHSSYVRLVPAALIDQIETNPEDLLDERRFHQVGALGLGDGSVRPAGSGSAGLDGRWWDASELRHFAVNRPAGVLRGQSDLVPLLPWLRRYRDWLTDRVRLNKYRTAYLWHVVVKGAGRREISQRQAELATPPAPGSIIVSNEGETWEAVRPQIQADDAQADGLALRLMIAAGAGVPLYWLAEAEHTAKGTAVEQSGPTFRHFRQRQLFFGWVMKTLAIDALRARGIDGVGPAEVHAEFPEMNPTEGVATAQAMRDLTESLLAAEGRGWLESAEAAQIFQHFIGETVNLPRTGNEPGAHRPPSSPVSTHQRQTEGTDEWIRAR